MVRRSRRILVDAQSFIEIIVSKITFLNIKQAGVSGNYTTVFDMMRTGLPYLI